MSEVECRMPFFNIKLTHWAEITRCRIVHFPSESTKWWWIVVASPVLNSSKSDNHLQSLTLFFCLLHDQSLSWIALSKIHDLVPHHCSILAVSPIKFQLVTHGFPFLLKAQQLQPVHWMLCVVASEVVERIIQHCCCRAKNSLRQIRKSAPLVLLNSVLHYLAQNTLFVGSSHRDEHSFPLPRCHWELTLSYWHGCQIMYFSVWVYFSETIKDMWVESASSQVELVIEVAESWASGDLELQKKSLADFQRNIEDEERGWVLFGLEEPLRLIWVGVLFCFLSQTLEHKLFNLDIVCEEGEDLFVCPDLALNWLCIFLEPH